MKKIEVPNSGPLAVDEARNELKADIITNCVKPIDAIEFVDDFKGGYKEINIDQLVNLPSIIASKTNAEAWLNDNGLAPLGPHALYDIGHMAEDNADIIIYQQLRAQVNSNLARFLSSSDFLTDFFVDELSLNPTTWERADTAEIIMSFLQPLHLVFSMYNDTPEAMDTTVSIINSVINQTYICLTSMISFDFNNQIDSKRFMQFKDYKDFVMLKYKDMYESMEGVFIYPGMGNNAFMLFLKQNAAMELYNWFDQVLYKIIDNIIRSFSNLNTFVYKDFAKMMLLEGKDKGSLPGDK